MSYTQGRSKEEIRQFVVEFIQSWLSDSVTHVMVDGDVDTAKSILETLQGGYEDTLDKKSSEWLGNMLEDDLDYRIDSDIEHAYSKILLIDELSIYSDAHRQYCKM